VIGFELLPNAHLLLHAHLAPHTHGHDAGAAPIVTRSPVVSGGHDGAVHRHDDGTLHSHEHDEPPEPGDLRPRLELRPYAPEPIGHGAHSLAHRDLASHEPPPPVVAPTPVLGPALDPPAIAAAEPRSRRPATSRARGPPA
jgi:hypothetical protein